METLCMKCGKSCKDEVRRGRRLVYCSDVPKETMDILLEGMLKNTRKTKKPSTDR